MGALPRYRVEESDSETSRDSVAGLWDAGSPPRGRIPRLPIPAPGWIRVGERFALNGAASAPGSRTPCPHVAYIYFLDQAGSYLANDALSGLFSKTDDHFGSACD